MHFNNESIIDEVFDLMIATTNEYIKTNNKIYICFKLLFIKSNRSYLNIIFLMMATKLRIYKLVPENAESLYIFYDLIKESDFIN